LGLDRHIQIGCRLIGYDSNGARNGVLVVEVTSSSFHRAPGGQAIPRIGPTPYD
jgi:hypothetical protein